MGASLAAAVLGSSCLLPVESDLMPELPPRKNRPPRIIPLAPSSSEQRISMKCNTPQPLEFQVSVEDPDIGDQIVAHWYTHEDNGDNSSVEHFRRQQSKPIGPGGLTTDIFFWTEQLGGTGLQNGTHIIELVIADGILVNREAIPKLVELPDGGSVEDRRYVEFMSWTVVLSCEPP